MNYAFSADNHSIEFSVPFQSFMYHKNGEPVVKLGNRMTVAFSLETSDQFSQPNSWASDASWPIRGYILAPPTPTTPTPIVTTITAVTAAGGLVAGALLAFGITTCYFTRRRNEYERVEDMSDRKKW